MNLEPIQLTQEGFKNYGEVIELESAKTISINEGLTTRFHDLMDIDVMDEGGKPIVNVFRTHAVAMPHQVRIMERHPLGSQGFMPLSTNPFLVLVGEGEDMVDAGDLKLFITNGKQGINLNKNTWHHYQLVLSGPQDFIVIDRGGSGENLQETAILDDVWISI